MTTIARAVTLRPFVDGDRTGVLAVMNASLPDYAWTLEELQHDDESWAKDPERAKYFRERVVAEEGGVIVGVSDTFNSRHAFVPENYHIELLVTPAARRRGIGAALYDAAMGVLRERRAHWVRDQVLEAEEAGIAFAQKIGAVELRRDWESRLDVAAFDPAPFASAPKRAADAGVSITTLADELRTDPDALRKAYDLHEGARVDVPSFDPPTRGTFERFEDNVLRSPGALPEAHFIAVRNGRYVGESAMGHEGTDASVIYQHLTGVLQDERGKGIAMVLKLRTIEYAKANGCRELRTWNASINRPMLAINEALGFAKQAAWISFGKDLSAE